MVLDRGEADLGDVPDGTDECLACDLTHRRRPLPGGVIPARSGWWVEDCVGHRPVPTPGTAIVGVGNEPLKLTHLDSPARRM